MYVDCYFADMGTIQRFRYIVITLIHNRSFRVLFISCVDSLMGWEIFMRTKWFKS